MAGTYDITCDQGATFALRLTWIDSAGTPVDLTGRTARMHVRAAVDAVTPAVQLTTENGRIALGGASGTVDLSIAAADTAALTPGSYVYDLEIVSGVVVSRIVEGAFSIRAEVTR